MCIACNLGTISTADYQGPRTNPPRAMSNEILFYDLSIQSPVRSNKCFAPNTLYAHFRNSQRLQLTL